MVMEVRWRPGELVVRWLRELLLLFRWLTGELVEVDGSFLIFLSWPLFSSRFCFVGDIVVDAIGVKDNGDFEIVGDDVKCVLTDDLEGLSDFDLVFGRADVAGGVGGGGEDDGEGN